MNGQRGLSRAAGALRAPPLIPLWDLLLIAIVATLAAAAFAERALQRTAPPAATSSAEMQRDADAALPSMRVAGAEGGRRDGEYLPLVAVSAVYPAAAQAAGTEGRCVVEYTISATGATREVRARECTPAGVFDRAAVAAARQFKYRPRIRDGVAVAVPGVRNEFRFTLAR